MPEFHYSKSATMVEAVSAVVRQMVTGYLEAAMFTEHADDNGVTVDAEFSALAVVSAHTVCSAFLLDSGAVLLPVLGQGYTSEQAGRDLWLTHNHHGVGFWDRGLGEAGETLTQLANKIGEAYVCLDTVTGDLHLEYTTGDY